MTVVKTSTPRRDALDLSLLLHPRRVAVVGANDRSESFTGGTVINLRRHGFDGEVYPVNPRRDVVGAYPAYPNLQSLPGPIDMSVIVVRADLVVSMLAQSVEAGAAAAIVISSGFGEGAADTAGRRRAEELQDFLRQTPIPVLGPSTTGMVNLNDGFVPRAGVNHLEPSRLRSGPIALISQSGAANNAVFNRAQSHGVPIGLAVATGVQANVSVWDIAHVAVKDPRIKVLAILVEDLGLPADYEPVLGAAAEAGKPVVLLRTGRSEVGRSAIATHTGSLAGNWSIEREMLLALGVVLVQDLDQLWEVASIAHHWGMPLPSPVRLGVVGLSGGEGALIADQAEDAGMEMAPVSAEFELLVGQKLELAGAGNPFDPTGEALGRPQNAIDAIAGFVERNDFDVTLVALNAQAAPTEDGLLDGMLESLSQAGGRIGLSYWEVPGFSDGLVGHLLEFPGPVLPGSHRMIAAIGAWVGARPIARAIGPDGADLPRLVTKGSDTYWSARRALQALGVPFADAELVHDTTSALRAAEKIGFPVVLKANVPSTTHKTAAGLVRIGVADEASLTTQFEDLRGAGDGVVVEQAVLSTSSLILGTTFDPHIGSVVVVGSGGRAAEHLADSAICPTRLLTQQAAREMLLRTGIGRFLEKHEPSHFNSVAELVFVLGHGVDGQRVSVDLNPLVITPTGVLALDARIEAVETNTP